MRIHPVIMIVEDELSSLTALLDALLRRFGADYRVIPHRSAKRALRHLHELVEEEHEEIALIIASQWMEEMKGIELLGKSREISRAAKRALLVPWGDHRSAPAILQGCAFGQLDNYLLKPWSPPEVHLYPAITEFLSEWTQAWGPKLEIVRIVGSEHSPRSHDLQELLKRNGIPFGFHSTQSEDGQGLLRDIGFSDAALPVAILLDGRALSNPTNAELADALGVTSRRVKQCDVAIVGAGPGGLAAAVYAASEGLRTVVIEREALGGQAGTSTLIRNYLGFPRGISGTDLAQRAYQQAWLFGAKYVFMREVTGLEARGASRVLALSDGTELSASAVIIATGANYRRIQKLERLVNAGVFYTAMADYSVTSGRNVFVTGGGNSAGQAVIHLAENANHVTLLVRGPDLGRGMSDYLVQQIAHLQNVEVRLNTEVADAVGERALERLVLKDLRTGVETTVPAEMLFVMIGALPHTDWLRGIVQRDDQGFVLTGRRLSTLHALVPDRTAMRLETSVPGVFAVGDVRSGSAKRVASAVGEGAVVVQYIHEYLENPVSVDALSSDLLANLTELRPEIR
ncbi:MAG: FAD-dependent oxidoreductase [Myxococcaceae bacterium]